MEDKITKCHAISTSPADCSFGMLGKALFRWKKGRLKLCLFSRNRKNRGYCKILINKTACYRFNMYYCQQKQRNKRDIRNIAFRTNAIIMNRNIYVIFLSLAFCLIACRQYPHYPTPFAETETNGSRLSTKL